MSRSRLGRFRLVLGGVAVLAAGGASGAAMGRYTVSGINPFYGQPRTADYDPGARVGLSRDVIAYEGRPQAADLSPFGGDDQPRSF